MSTSILEIVEVSDGEVVLKQAGSDNAPLVTIRFSEESRIYLTGNGLEVAKAMIQAGIQVAAELAEAGDMDAEEETTSPPRIIH